MTMSTGDRYITCPFCGITHHQNWGHMCTATEKTAWKITNSDKLSHNDVATLLTEIKDLLTDIKGMIKEKR